MNLLHLTTRTLRLAALGLVVALAQGCATGPNANPADPLEPFNRAMFSFNDGVDRTVLKPVATAYRDVTPSPVRKLVKMKGRSPRILFASCAITSRLAPT